MEVSPARAQQGLRSQRDARPVEVPERLGRPHPAIVAVRDGTGLKMARTLRARALRILQGLVAEAERRGMHVAVHGDAALRIGRAPHLYLLSIREEMDRVPHEPSTRELQEAQRSSWIRIPEYDAVPSGRLVLELPTTYEGNRRRWADGKRFRLEDKLGDVLVELDVRAARDEQRRLDREREEQELHRRWQAAMDDARLRYVKAQRTAALLEQATSWQQMQLVREYCDALEGRISTDDTTDTAEARSWLEWARAYAERTDPLTQLPGMHSIKDPKPDDLRPFLHGWDPYRPGH